MLASRFSETRQRKTITGCARSPGMGSGAACRIGVGGAIGTIRRMESFDGDIGSQTGTLLKVQTALEKGGIEFLDDDRPGVRLKERPRKRRS